MLVEVQEDSLLTIPEEIIEKVGWQEGDLLEITVKNGSACISRVDAQR